MEDNVPQTTIGYPVVVNLEEQYADVPGESGTGYAIRVLVDGARSMETGAPLTAAAWYRAALGLLADAPERQGLRPDLLLALARTYARAGELPKCRATLAELHAPDTPGQSDPYQVSQREFEIATLVTEGRTNRQIARQLMVSHKTVETHLARIFAKVAVSSRAELAGLVGRARIVARPRRKTRAETGAAR
ncbi:LuxR C-terminal-related transcriptional regulator [Nonomuraea sp. NPDC046802]|uniref:helix-turn-helix transcriptional regulator n=1 Tax=Nonomuraea sp. NPDC046802 TaxID=3154919 RepID=UPI0033CCC553